MDRLLLLERVSPLEVGLIVQSLKGEMTPDRLPDAFDQGSALSLSVDELKELVLKLLDDEQARDIVSIDLTGKSDVADQMVIASGRSHRHVGALADKLSRELKERGFGKVAVEGMPAADWVLIDAGDVIVHLFRPEVRTFYNLERIWAPELFGEAGATDFAPAMDSAADIDEPLA